MMPEARLARAVSEDEAHRLAHELFGMAGTVAKLPGEFDDNFHLRTNLQDEPGRDFVLKVMHPARTREFLDLQCSALRYLALHAPDLPLPRVIASNKDEPFASARINGEERFVWMLSFIPGKVLAEVRPRSAELLTELGAFLGKMDRALHTFSHPGARRELKWDMARALWAREYLSQIENPARRALAQRFLWLYERDVLPALPKLRSQVIYGDANDYNVLVRTEPGEGLRVASLIDFGDMHSGVTASEPAIAAAYAILGEKDVLAAARSVIAGFHRECPLRDEEIALLYALVGTRLAVSVVNSAYRTTVKPGDPYVTVTEAPAWDALERWAKIFPRFAYYAFREACGLEPVPRADSVRHFLSSKSSEAAPLLGADLRREPCLVLDLSVSSKLLGADPKAVETPILTETVFRKMREVHAVVAIGRYAEARPLYPGPHFAKSSSPIDERRTVHLGIDLFAEAGTPVHAPFDATVHLLANNALSGDYGPLVVLRHLTSDSTPFFTLYGHLTVPTLQRLRLGQAIAHGEVFAEIGAPPENGGWPPHLHFQVILDLLDLDRDFPGVAYASQSAVWKSLSPDPNLLLAIPKERFPQAELNSTETAALRRQLLGKNLGVSYRKPLKIVRGWMQYLYDETGRAYLDVYNNVPLVGHSHPRVVRAVQEQIALLNTNTRYLHDAALQYAQRLTRLLPAPLRVCYFVNSGSEANELALRLARAHTDSEDVIVLEHAYHGNTSTLIDISPYKFAGPGGTGRKSWVHVAAVPDDYRGPYRRDDPEAGKKYANAVATIIDKIKTQGRRPGAFIAETLPSVAGQIVFPKGYLREVYRSVRQAGGVCIADEVQVGFGRLGTPFWGFEAQEVVPDIVVLGKPIGNGFPLGAVITTAEIAGSFANGMEFFSTFGGNPVACSAGLAVLDVLEAERLPQNALQVGTHLFGRLRQLRDTHALIGDVRGMGLFLGLDLVLDRETREAAPHQAAYIVNRLRECGVLTGTDGPFHNVLKLRPPLIFTEPDADLFASTLDAILAEDPALARSL